MTTAIALDLGRTRGSDEYARAARDRAVVVGVVALALAVACAAIIVTSGAGVVLVAALAGACVVIAVIARPTAGVYLFLAGAILFEQYEIRGVAPLTASVHFFQNLSAFTPVPIRLSLSDLLMLLTLGSTLARRVGRRTAPLVLGPFGAAVAGFAAIFVFGLIVGVVRGPGWDLDAGLQELRGVSQMVLAYFLAVNLVRDRRQLGVIAWILVALVAVKAAQAILNWQSAQTLGLDLDAVTGHEDVIFFDLAIAILVVMVLTAVRSKLMYALIAVAPLIITAELLTERRVAFVALGAVLAAIAVLTFARSFRRGLLFGAVVSVMLGGYLCLFWDDTGPLGQPARAVRGVVEPSSLSARDRSSNHWRDIENRNIAFTVRELPLTGVGVGQRYLFREEPPPLGPPKFFYWRNFTHNAALWPWLKAGIFGAFALWFLAARVLLLGSALYVRLRDAELRWIATLPVATVIIWMTYAGVEPAFTNSRTLIALGTMLALSAPIASLGQRGSELTR